MTRPILLVRHGHSAHVADERCVDADGARRFTSAYDAAGIAEDDVPPAALVAATIGAHVVASSDLPRALDSARCVAPGRELSVTPLLREIELETPNWLQVRLPIAVWDGLDYFRWSYRLFRKADHEHMRRADAAAGWLIERVGEGSTAAVVTHGGFRRLVAARLSDRGWNADTGRRSYANWSTWSFVT